MFSYQDFVKAMPELQISTKVYQSFRSVFSGFILAKCTNDKRLRLQFFVLKNDFQHLTLLLIYMSHQIHDVTLKKII